LPNRYTDAVGPFVFLDHVIPKLNPSVMNSGTGAHPHRGIATLSYILEGEDEHFDSAGNYAKVYSGGIQWMKAGNGIIHDETINVDSTARTNRIHGFQFWINLPSKNKAEKPEYLSIGRNEVPRKALPNESGWIKVIAGDYEELRSKIPNYGAQFLYHIHLQPGKSFTIFMEEKVEVAAFLPTNATVLNDTRFGAGEFVEFDRNAGEIAIENSLQETADILLFGGAPYTEPIVAEGPFIMNSQAEIAEAYRDYFAGKYGEIHPRKSSV
jgi:hypothetical protein